jgi:cobalt-zinc-cadmium efflux system outer membrane protein
MTARRLIPLIGAVLVSGCLYHVREQTDEAAMEMARHPFDVAPEATARPSSTDQTLPPPRKEQPAEKPKGLGAAMADVDVRTVVFLQRKDEPGVKDVILPPMLSIPERIPGSEAELIKLPKEKAREAAYLRQVYPPLPALPAYPKGVMSPEGRPYTLSDLHRLAVENSPTIRQAAADVETARGNMIQASMYPNPNFGWQTDPSNNNATTAAVGIYFEQLIKTAGKLKLATAAALKSLENAELALKRARSDLATAVRNAYFAFLVARETVEVTEALARFTDEIYQLQVNLLRVGVAAAYEPAALRAQAQSARLAYRQAIETFIYDWKQLAAVIGLRDLPLSEVAGQVDQLIPRYDYNKVLAHVLKNHTDVLTAGNSIEMQKYNLKSAQVTAIPDIFIHYQIQRDTALAPMTWYSQMTMGVALPVWDQNRGGILAAEGALTRALQEPKRVELNIANNLAAAFTAYRTSLEALEAYRKEILPDQVRYYRGVHERRRIDPNAQFGDLVTAQTALAASVTTYLTTLGSLWSAVVTLADFIQTDDLFQFASAEPLPPLPKFEPLPPMVPGHLPGCPVVVPPAHLPPPVSDQAASPGTPLPASGQNGAIDLATAGSLPAVRIAGTK